MIIITFEIFLVPEMSYLYRHNPRKSQTIEKKSLNNAQVTSMKKKMVNGFPVCVCLVDTTQINYNDMSLSNKHLPQGRQPNKKKPLSMEL